jgi:hypothetical protein
MALLGSALFFAACPDRQAATDGIARDTLPAPPPVADAAPDGAAQEVILAPMGGFAARGIATLTPEGAVTVMAVALQQAPPNDVLPVRLHVGRCDDEGPERAALEPIRTDTRGTGMAEARIRLPAHEIMTGQHYLMVYVAYDGPDRAVACGDLPERADLHPGLVAP